MRDERTTARRSRAEIDCDDCVVVRRPRRDRRRAWAALLAAQPSATPFVSLAYLRALHDSGSAVAATGWAPHFLLLERDGELVAACPLYLKDHSYGEYVFDWAWADAYQRHGLDYYPKLLGAVPFTPVPGPRLLARTHEHRLLAAARHRAAGALGAGLSSVHLLFLDDADQARGARGRLVDAQHGAVPLAATARPRRTPTSTTSSPACSARSARRSSRSGAASPRPA